MNSAGDVLAAFTRRARRNQLIYLIVVGVIVLTAGIAFAGTVARGEINHVHSVLATDTAPRVLESVPAPQQHERWHSGDKTASGTPYYNGTVVTYSQHTVSGRNALTGTPRWSFTRSDRVICDVVQQQNQTVALFQSKGDCTQVTTLSTDTGARIWERTLFSDGHIVNGMPEVIAANDSIVFLAPSVIWAVSLIAGTDQWLYTAPTGCVNKTAVRGSSGVLASQECSDGSHLLLRSLYGSDLSDTNKTDPVRWRIPTPAAMPIAADGFVAAIDMGSGLVLRYSLTNGKILSKVPLLRPSPSTPGPVSTEQVLGMQLLWTDARLYALNADGTQQLWSVPATALPMLSQVTDSAATVRLAVGRNGVVAALDPVTGSTAAVYDAPTAASSRVIRVGSGFLIANDIAVTGAAMTVTYQ